MKQRLPMLSVARIEQLIFLIRGQRLMLDRDLAALYGVTTGNLNKAVRRNRERFPDDFMFQLTPPEAARLIFQSGISKPGRGGRRKPIWAFSEQGVAMLSSVLRSPRAVQVNIAIMRAFVRLHEALAWHKELAHKLRELERKIEGHDASIRTLLEAIRQLMNPPEPPRKQIGFHAKESRGAYRVQRNGN
jgi:hypothetical protein